MASRLPNALPRANSASANYFSTTGTNNCCILSKHLHTHHYHPSTSEHQCTLDSSANNCRCHNPCRNLRCHNNSRSFDNYAD